MPGLSATTDFKLSTHSGEKSSCRFVGDSLLVGRQGPEEMIALMVGYSLQGQTNLHLLHSTKLLSYTWKQCPRCFSVDGRSIGRPWQFWDWVDRPIAHQQNPINQNRMCISMVLTRGPVVRELPMKQVDVAPRGLSAFSAFSISPRPRR